MIHPLLITRSTGDVVLVCLVEKSANNYEINADIGANNAYNNLKNGANYVVINLSAHWEGIYGT